MAVAGSAEVPEMAERPHQAMFESCQQHAYEMATEAEALLRSRPAGELDVERANALARVGRIWAEMAQNELWADHHESGAAPGAGEQETRRGRAAGRAPAGPSAGEQGTGS